MRLRATGPKRSASTRLANDCCGTTGCSTRPGDDGLLKKIRIGGAATRPSKAAPALQPPLPDRPSIAVLPFDNLSGEPEHRVSPRSAIRPGACLRRRCATPSIDIFRCARQAEVVGCSQRTRAGRPIELDGGNSIGYSIHARVLSFQGDHEQAVRLAEQGIGLNPNDWMAHHALGYVLIVGAASTLGLKRWTTPSVLAHTPRSRLAFSACARVP